MKYFSSLGMHFGFSHSFYCSLIIMVLSGDGVLWGQAEKNKSSATDFLFQKTAFSYGYLYKVGYRQLLLSPQTLKKILPGKQFHSDWQERNLAKALLLQLNFPKKWERWTNELKKANHKKQENKAIKFSIEVVPLILHLLREIGPKGWSSQNHNLFEKKVKILTRFLEQDTIPFLIELDYWMEGRLKEIDVFHFKNGEPSKLFLKNRFAFLLAQENNIGYKKFLKKEERLSCSQLLRVALLLEKMEETSSLSLMAKHLTKVKTPRLIETFAGILGRARRLNTLTALFNKVISLVEDNEISRQTSAKVNYLILKKALLHYGVEAESFWVAQFQKQESLSRQIIAHSILEELKDLRSFATFSACLLEEVYLYKDLNKIKQLATLPKTPLLLKVLKNCLQFYRSGVFAGDVALVMAEIGESSFLDYCAPGWENQSKIIGAVLLLNNTVAVPCLKQLIEKATTEDIILQGSLVLKILNGDSTAFDPLLNSSNEAISEITARVMWKQKKLKALSYLVRLTSQKTEAFHLSLMNAILEAGDFAINPIIKYQSLTKSWKEQLVCEVLLLHLQRPEVVNKLQKIWSLKKFWRKIIPPPIDYFQGEGERLAFFATVDSIPLLEQIVAFKLAQDGFAPFMLASFKKERSLTLLLKVIPTETKKVASQILTKAIFNFGAPGIEALEKFPLADPFQGNYRGRLQRYRQATTELIDIHHPQAMENLLAAIENLSQNYSDQNREKARAYLKLIGRFSDERFIEPVLELVKREPIAFWPLGIVFLKKYSHPKILKACKNYLALTKEYDSNPALVYLLEYKGTSLFSWLTGLIEDPSEESSIQGIKVAGQIFTMPKYSDEAICFFSPLFIEILADKKKSVAQKWTAHTLAKIPYKKYQNSILNPSLALARWIVLQKEPPVSIIEYIAQEKSSKVAKVIFNAYQKNRNVQLGSFLSKIKYPRALKEFKIVLREKMVLKETTLGFPEIDYLGAFGEAGIEAVYSLFLEANLFSLRMKCVVFLGRQKVKKAFPVIKEELRKLIYFGFWNPHFLENLEKEPNQEKQYLYYLELLSEALVSISPRKAYPILSTYLLRTKEQPFQKNIFIWKLKRIEKQFPDLVKTKIPFNLIPEIVFLEKKRNLPFLKACDLIWKFIAFDNNATDEIKCESLKELLALDSFALKAFLELCYPTNLSPEITEVKQWIHQLSEPSQKEESIVRLALSLYPSSWLIELVSKGNKKEFQMVSEIWNWRKKGYWFLQKMQHLHLLEKTTILFIEEWPIEKMRAFCFLNLDRIARISFVAYGAWERPLSPLLASLRYSLVLEERKKVLYLLERFPPSVSKHLNHLRYNGLNGYPRHASRRWGKLPDLELPANEKK